MKAQWGGATTFYVRLIAGILGATLFVLGVGYAVGLRTPQLQISQVSPMRIPSGSPDTLIDIFTFDAAMVRAVTLNGREIPITHAGKFEINGMIPSNLLSKPGHLRMVLEPYGKATFEPVDIVVFPRLHQADLALRSSQSAVRTDEKFDLTISITNRSSYALYVAKQIEPFIDGGPASMYSLEVRSEAVPIFYVPKRVSVTAGSFFAKTPEAYAAAGLLIRLEPSGSHARTISATMGDLTHGLFSESVPEGRYIIRAYYAGAKLALEGFETSVSDEQIYSNEVTITVKN